ncbi:hypothetical protein SAMN05216174_1011087 [Actinokineospora iranica]|uniref:Peptidase inhibitor family I36 n=2 Tax=Actinokineospora iranica TaxID=1271860 RepID=A0A1G6KTH8_9PSEU|nr:hypothetical protein SAMN05216174_1011087 [Actinokineospora iranica]
MGTLRSRLNLRSVKKVGSRMALATALGAAAIVGGPGAASAADVQPQYWNYKCDDGRACVYHVNGDVWNVEHCGVTGLDDFYRYAKAHGNAFTIFYANIPSVFIPAWSERSVPSSRATGVQVYC